MSLPAFLPCRVERRARRGGVAVLDRGLASVLAAAALLGLVGVYFTVRAGSSFDLQYAAIQTVIHEVEAVSRNFSSYDGIDTTYVIKRGHIPAKLVSGNLIRFGEQGVLTVSAWGASPTRQFAITASMVRSRDCVHLAVRPFDDRQASLAINGVTLANPVSVTDVEAGCNRYPTASMMWVLG